MSNRDTVLKFASKHWMSSDAIMALQAQIDELRGQVMYSAPQPETPAWELPAGPELDKATHRVMYTYEADEADPVPYRRWSRDAACVGEMLDWLKKQGKQANLYLRSDELWHVANIGVPMVFGWTVAEALARAVCRVAEEGRND